MILSLRQRHRWMVCTLAVVLPATFVFGVAARRIIPLIQPVSFNLGVELSAYRTLVWSDSNSWPGERISTSLWSDSLGSLAVEFAFDKSVGPDVLVYWLTGDTLATDRLPDNAQLLGPFSNRERLPFPGKPGGQHGRFLLYSLANQKVIAKSEVVGLQPASAGRAAAGKPGTPDIRHLTSPHEPGIQRSSME